jgi:ketosteroid isomerase-like protein
VGRLHGEPSGIHDAGSQVVVEGRYTGTFKATSKQLDAQFCHVWTLSDGKVGRFQQYVDTAKLWAVMTP